MIDFSHLILLTFSTLFPITNPLGNAGIFLSLTADSSPKKRHQQAFMGAVYMFIILEGFLIGGSYLLSFFGLSLEGIRIAGCLVITKIGFDLLQPKQENTHTEEEHAEAKSKEDISFSPLAMPLLAGPGAIASVMSISTMIPSHSLAGMGAVTIGIAVSSATCWIILRQSEAFMKFLGVNGANALTKMMGFLLLCIGIQLGIDGVIGLAE